MEETKVESPGMSVKERTQQFNRLASVEDELSPARAPRSSEKDRSNKSWVSVTSYNLNLQDLSYTRFLTVSHAVSVEQSVRPRTLITKVTQYTHTNPPGFLLVRSFDLNCKSFDS